MARDEAKTAPTALADEIRSQLGSPEVRRYCLSLPTFSVDAEVPARLRELVSQLQRAEIHRLHCDRRRESDTADIELG